MRKQKVIVPPTVITVDTDKLAEELQKARGEESLRDFARKVGVNFSTLSRVENGHMPDLLTYVAICDANKWKLDEFIVRWKVVRG